MLRKKCKNKKKKIGGGGSVGGNVLWLTESQFPDQRLNPCPLQGKAGVLNSEPIGSAQEDYLHGCYHDKIHVL